jgi:hypothetical protein
MKRAWIWMLVLVVTGSVAGCGKKGSNTAKYFEKPEKVIQGLMAAYETRNDSLYASFLADDFRYTFEPEGADSVDVLGWGKEEEVLSASSLFKTPEVQSVRYKLYAGAPKPAEGPGRQGWMTVPVSGGQLVISVKGKDPTIVALNRQEIVMRQVQPKKWQIVEWHDYPVPASSAAAGDSARGQSGAMPVGHEGSSSSGH